MKVVIELLFIGMLSAAVATQPSRLVDSSSPDEATDTGLLPGQIDGNGLNLGSTEAGRLRLHNARGHALHDLLR